MKNKQLIDKIVNNIKHKNHKLSLPITIEDEVFTHIVVNSTKNETDIYKYSICNDKWETSLYDLTNRELLKLLKSL